MKLNVLCRLVTGLFFLLLLVGCETTGKSTSSSSFKKHYSYQPPASERGKVCVNSCQQELRHCETGHNSVNQACMNQQHAAATQQFELYRQTQIAQGDKVSDTWRSFYHPEMCRKTDKGCMADYRACYQLCGGKVAMTPITNSSSTRGIG